MDGNIATLVSWNVNRLPGSRASEVLAELRDKVGTALVLLQETGVGWSSADVQGWDITVSPRGRAAVCAPDCWSRGIQWKFATERVAAIGLGAAAVISLYAPDSGNHSEITHSAWRCS